MKHDKVKYRYRKSRTESMSLFISTLILKIEWHNKTKILIIKKSLLILHYLSAVSHCTENSRHANGRMADVAGGYAYIHSSQLAN